MTIVNAIATWDVVIPLTTAILGALAASIIGAFAVAAVEVRRHDREIHERDEDLEEWLVVKNREMKNRFDKLEQDARARGVAEGGTIPAGRRATKAIYLYEYREELRAARNFRLRIEIEELWTHRLVRLLNRSGFPDLETPERAAPLIDAWNEGTERNALTFGLDDINAHLPDRATSKAVEP